VSVCVASYRRHGPPNVATLATELEAALDGRDGELVIALNGVTAAGIGAPEWAAVVDLGVNRGVSVGWNAAAAAASGDVLVFANDDLSLGAGSLAMLADAVRERDDAGVVGPVGTRWNVAEARHVAYLPKVSLPAGTLRECEVLSGFLLATPREVFEGIGGFDEAFTPCSWEEVDYCTAVRLRAGLRCYEVAGVPLHHEFAISAKPSWRRVRYDGRSESLGRIAKRNRRYFVQKWKDAPAG
jgi:GT2 family glycosyltransferase